MESSCGLTISPYNFKYPYLKEHAISADLVGEFKDDDGVVQKKVNHWSQVFDFTKREDGELNYSLILSKDFSVIDFKSINQSLDIPG